MNRAARILLGVVVITGALSAGRLALPGSAFACSCIAPPAGAPPFDGSEDAVLVGTVGAHVRAGQYAFAVERWFKGGAAPLVNLQSAETPLGGGEIVFDTCGLRLQPGSHLVLAASSDGSGVLWPGSCSPNAFVESAEGEALLAAAVRTFGPGVIPGQPPPAQQREPTIDVALLAILAVLGAVALVVFGVLILAFGRREPPAQPPK